MTYTRHVLHQMTTRPCRHQLNTSHFILSSANSKSIRRPVASKTISDTNAQTLPGVERKHPAHHHQLPKSHNQRQFTSTRPSREGETKTVTITYVDTKNEASKTVQAEIGKDLLSVAHEYNIDLEGACGGEMACATCHLIFEKKVFDTLPEKEEEEEDMLDLAFEVTETSRLGCQILVREDFDGTTVKIPDDGF
jgi:ferredoxin-2, mitochondrial